MHAHKDALRKIEKDGPCGPDMPLWLICRDQVGHFLTAKAQTVD